MSLETARDQVTAALAQPVSARAPAAAHADVILSLSSAAQALTTAPH